MAVSIGVRAQIFIRLAVTIVVFAVAHLGCAGIYRCIAVIAVITR
jgi:hypothetical protein